MEICENKSIKEVVGSFAEENSQEGLRVFVAGGSRAGMDDVYVDEAYNLGRQIARMDFKLDFGLSSSGIMGAVARGVLDGWNKKKCKTTPIQGITTKEYYSLYQTDEILGQIEDVIVAQTLEERKKKLLNADFVVFAPGGVGTLDELAYDCVAMQDGLLPIKPFILYNVDSFFHHMVEYLKEISAKGFADPVPFIIVDNSDELSIVFRLLKLRYKKGKTTAEVYAATRQLIYELPYFIKKKPDSSVHVEDIIADMQNTSLYGTAEERQELANEIELAYLEKEIERMYDRLSKTGRDTSIVSDKLANLKKRKKENAKNKREK